jgi:hypothetical protein
MAIDLKNFETIAPIITFKEEGIREFLRNAIVHFFEELDFYVEQNKDRSFLLYFNEHTYLSLLGNAVTRNDNKREISLIHEYNVKCSDGVIRRCDCFLKYKDAAFFIESKLEKFHKQIEDGHWDIEAWIKDDEQRIRPQLLQYYEAEYPKPQEKNSENDIYSKHYLMTIVFKILKEKPEEYRKKAKTNLPESHKNTFNRDWFYSVAFLKKAEYPDELNGLEVYGTIECKK